MMALCEIYSIFSNINNHIINDRIHYDNNNRFHDNDLRGYVFIL